MRLLVTRPAPDGEYTAAVLRARGHEVILAPAFRIETVADADFGQGPFTALVMTSANAARAIALHRRYGELIALPVFTVGQRTAEAARQAGFSTIAAAAGGSPDLVRLIVSQLKGSRARLLYLAGEQRSADLAGALADHQLSVDTVVVYRAVANPALPQELPAALIGLDGVLHYSRRSAEAFVIAARTAGVIDAALNATHFCLSREVVVPLQAAGAMIVKTAPRPEEAALIELLSFD